LKDNLDATIAIVVDLKDRLEKLPTPPPPCIKEENFTRTTGEEGPNQICASKEAMEGLKSRVIILEAQVAAAGTVSVSKILFRASKPWRTCRPWWQLWITP
jgi:hypothetical protein